ncbi:hypothetical protein BH11BAC2_BH11BAC2_06610 [soil metagenome]
MLRRSKAILSAAALVLMLFCLVQNASAQAPNAEFQADDTIVCVGNTILFTDLTVSGSAALTNWDWTFGDAGVSTNQNPTHAYALGGNYSVRLIVTDANGAKDTAVHSIYVLVAHVNQSTVRICSPQSSTTLTSVDPGIAGVSGTWFTSSSAIIASPANDTTVVSNLISGTYLFFWVVSDGTCSDADQVTVTVDQPVTTNAGPDQQICSSPGTAIMGASNPTPGSGLWTTTSTAIITTPSNRNTTITGLTTAGIYTFIWTTTSGSCTARDTMLITVSSPLTPNAGPDQTACLSPGTATLAALSASPGTGLWTTSGAAIITNPTSINATVAGLTTGTNTFIWTVTNGACITRDTMLIVVSTPRIANAGADIQVCTSTASGTLNGNSPLPGTGLWTAVTSGTITSPTSATTTVTGLSTAGFYSFVWTITVGACVSRDTMTIIVRAPVVANAGLDQQFCTTSTTTLTGNSAAPGTGLWSTTSTSIIATPSTATTSVSNIPYGSNIFVYTTTYGACVSRDTVIVRRDSLITANAGPDQALCETTTTTTLAGNNPTPGTGLWTKLNGGTITTPTAFNTTITGLTTGTHNFVWTVTNGTCVSRDTMRIVVSIQIPSNAGIDQSICQGSTVTLSGNNPNPATGLWTTSSTAIIASPSNATTNVSGLTNAGTYTFIWTVTNGACILKDTVRVVVDSSITANAGPDQSFCTTSTASLSGNAFAPGIGLWSSLGTATLTSTNTSNTTANNLVYGNNIFVWSITNGSCVKRDTVVIRRDSLITANAGLDQQVCAGTASIIMAANSASPGTGLWTTTSTAVITTPTSATTTVTGILTAGTYTFVWRITNGTCTSRDTMVLRVDQNIIASAGPDQAICSANSATLAGNNPSPGTGLWSTTSSAVITTPTSQTSTITGLGVGSYTLVWTITNGTCISRDTVIIRIDSLRNANAGPDQSICSGTNLIMNANTAAPGTGLWTALSSGTITTPTSPTTTITGLSVAGTYNFVWTITNGACVSRDTVAITVSTPVIAAAGQDQAICSANSATLAGNNPSPGTGLWSTLSAAIITTPTSANSTITGLAVGSYTLVWTITNGACITSDTVVIRVDSLRIANAGPDQAICSGTTATMSANIASPGTGIWTALSGGTINTPSDPSTTITGLSTAGTYNFVWTITNGACVSRDTVAITVSTPVIATAGTDQNLCNATTTNLNGSNPAPGTGVWTTTSTAIIASPGAAATSVSSLPIGTSLFIWTITNGSCITADTVAVTIDSLINASAGPDQAVCSGTTVVMSANPPAPGVGVWIALSGGTITTVSSETTTITGLSTPGVYTFVWNIINGSCTASDTVVVNVSDPVPALAGTDQSLCESFATSLVGNDPTPATGLWTNFSGAIIVDPTDPLSAVSGLSYGANNFIWTITNGTCITADTVIINVDSLIISNAGADQILCSGSTININANTPASGIGTWQALNGGVISSVNSASTNISGLLSAGSYQFVWTIDNGACNSSDTILITIDSLIAANAGTDQQLCDNFSSTLNGNTVTPGIGAWTTISSASITDPTDPLSSVNGLSYGANDFVWTVTNGVCTSTDTISISVANLIAADAGFDDVICANPGVLSLSAVDPSPGTGLWTATNGGVFADSSAFATTVTGLTTSGVYEFIWTVSNGICSSSDTMYVTVDSNEVALAGPDQLLCETQTTANLAANTAVLGNGVWTTFSTAIINDPTDPNTLISGLAIGTYQFIWTISNGSCVSEDTVDVVVSQLATVADAGADQQACENAAGVVLGGNTPLIGSGLWSSLGAAIADNPADPNSTVSGLVIGLNGFVWTITNGGCSNTDTTYIVATPNPIADAGVDQFVTAGTPVTIGGAPSGTSGVPPYTYAWTPSLGLDSDTIANPLATLFATQSYTLIVTDSLGCYGTDTVVVYVNDPPIALNDTIGINEDSTVVISALGNDTDPDNNINPGSVQIVFGPFNGSASVDPLTGDITYIPNLNFNGLDSIFYSVCDSGIPVYCDTAWIFINLQPVNDPPLAVDDSASTDQDSCITIAITLNDSDIENSLLLSSLTIVTGPANGTFTLDTLTGLLTYCPDSGFVGIDTLVYSICDSGIPLPGLCDTALVIITVNPLNHAPVALNDSVTVCTADSALIKVLFNDTDLDGDTLTVGIVQGPYNGTAVLDSNQQITYLANSGYSGLDSLAYSLCDNAVPSACDTAWVFIMVHPAPQISAVTSGVVCFGDSTGTIDIAVVGNAPFEYSWNTGALTEDLDSLVAGTYTIVVTDSNSCSMILTDSVAGPTSPLLGILNLQPVLCHNDSSGAIDLQMSGGTAPYTFTWSNGQVTEDLDSLAAGIYTVQVTDTNGCVYTISDTIIQPDSALIATLTHTDVYCLGDSSGSVQVAVSGGTPGYTYLWNTTDTAQNIGNLSAGTYSVTISDAYSCTLTLTDTVFSTGTPIVLNPVVNSPKCLESIFGNITLSPSGGVSPYTYLWNTADTLSLIDSLLAGTYSVAVTDSNGCFAVDTIVIADSSALILSNSGGNNFCEGDSIILSVPVYSNVTYAWSLNGTVTGDTLTSLTVTQSGDYSIQATAGCGNFNAGPININVNALPLTTVTSPANILCDSVLTLSATGGNTYSWSPAALCSSPNTSVTTVSPLYTTIFTVQVTDTNGCSVMDSVSVTVQCDTLDVPNGFSPNGDGINDFFVIGGLIRYPDGLLQIFNRWGNLVYKMKHYDNTFNGFSNIDRIKLGKELPDGTYYFIFDPNNGESAKTGYVILRR